MAEALSYIAFGSNLGDLVRNYDSTGKKLQNTPKIRVLRSSPLYQTEPFTRDDKPQPWYLNAVFEICTSLTPQDLMQHLKTIEASMGRQQAQKWQPRTVDLDILFYEDIIYHDNKLDIPHKEIAKRKFVLKPLCDLNPELYHPEFKMTVKELLKNTPDKSTVIEVSENPYEGCA